MVDLPPGWLASSPGEVSGGRRPHEVSSPDELCPLDWACSHAPDDIGEGFHTGRDEATFHYQFGLSASTVLHEDRAAVDALHQQGRSKSFAKRAPHVLDAGQ